MVLLSLRVRRMRAGEREPRICWSPYCRCCCPCRRRRHDRQLWSERFVPGLESENNEDPVGAELSTGNYALKLVVSTSSCNFFCYQFICSIFHPHTTVSSFCQRTVEWVSSVGCKCRAAAWITVDSIALLFRARSGTRGEEAEVAADEAESDNLQLATGC